MKNSNYTVRVIEPETGFWLTPKKEPKDIREKSFSKKIFLAANDSVYNYKEVSDAEKQKVDEEIQKLIEKDKK